LSEESRDWGMTPEGQLDPHGLAHELEQRGARWADSHAAAELLEKTHRIVLAQITNDYRLLERGLSRKAAEDLALGSEAYIQHIEATVEARRVANIARANYDAIRVRIEAMRTVEATKRAEIGNYRRG